jgi:signal transduction histidine kinase
VYDPAHPPDPASDLLSITAMPEVAAALRARATEIVRRWDAAVNHHLPDADPLTIKQVRDSIPAVLEKIAAALESDTADATAVLADVSTAHGVARFQENYNVEELITEYRLLRRIVLEEIALARGGSLTPVQSVVVDMAIDVALQRGVATFVKFLTAQLGSAAAAESKYLAYLSHDLRNSLNNVALTLELLSGSLASRPEFREEAKDVAAAHRAIFQTIDGMNRLLQAERLRKGAVKLKLGPVRLRELADELIKQVAPLARAKPLALENRTPAGATAHSDRELLTLVLQNLLGNAVKFSNRGTIRIEAAEDQTGWRVYVSDHGPGNAPEQIPVLFDAFSRGSSETQSGVGLGLNIASHAARLLGTELTVSTKLGEGSTFSFSVPAAKPTSNC